MKWRSVAALFVAVCKANDIDEKLSAESAADEAASKKASCWCHDYEEELNARGREIDFQLRHLETQKNSVHFSNEALRLEIAKHNSEAEQHQQALDSGSAIRTRNQDTYEEEKAFHENAIESIHKALDKIPEGSGGEVRGALQGLKQTFTNKMNEAESRQNTAMQGVLDAKSEMLRLAKQGAETKSSRLADGVVVVEESGRRISAYSTQESADATLRSALSQLCDTLTSESAERTQLRQAAVVAVSEANAAKAAAAAQQAYSSVGFLKRASKIRVSNKLGEVSAKSTLDALLTKGAEVEQDLTELLSQSKLDTQLIASQTGVDAKVKAAVAEMGKKADANMAAFPALFEAVRTAGQKSVQADKTLTSELASDKTF